DLSAAASTRRSVNEKIASMRRAGPGILIVVVLFLTTGASADDVLHPVTVNVDRPTLVTLGVQLLVGGDDDHDAQVTLRYRPLGAPTWKAGMNLFRVHPESVVGRA